MSKAFIFFFIIVLAALIIFSLPFIVLNLDKESVPELEIHNFNECLSMDYAVIESYPRQCQVPGGNIFIEDIGNVIEKSDLIRIYNPRPNQVIESPLLINGEARGFWYFEASFPIKLFDGNGELLAVIPAQAQGEWMTEDFVSFEAEINFNTPDTKNGLLILEKDNPSGLAQNADLLRVPIRFKLP